VSGGHEDVEPPPPINITGSWYGVKVQGGLTGTMLLQQKGSGVFGTFVPSLGVKGTVSGEMNENIIRLVLSHASPRSD